MGDAAVSEAHDWVHERNDYIEGSLLDEQERRDWERQRDDDLGLDVERPGDAAELWARERFEVESRCELERIAERAVIAQFWRDLYERDIDE